MAPFLRRGLECFYCGRRSTQSYTTGLRQWQCTSCDAVNYLDAKGQITDPPLSAINSAPNAYAQQPRRSVSPLPITQDVIFCQTCLKNQALKARNLADYLPPPSDPAYSEYEKLIPEYSRKLDERYPQVCADCAPRVQQRLREAGYVAKTDFLRHRLDGTQKVRKSSARWDCPPFLAYGGCVGWWVGLLGSILWHLKEISVLVPDLASYALHEEDSILQVRLRAYLGHTLSQSAAASLLRSSVGISIACFWWNPSLLHTSRLGDSNPWEFYKLQAILIAVRTLGMYFLLPARTTDVNAHTVAAIHAITLAFDLVVSVISYRIGVPPRAPPISLRQDLDASFGAKPRSAGPAGLKNPAPPLSRSSAPQSKNTRFPIGSLSEQRAVSAIPGTVAGGWSGHPPPGGDALSVFPNNGVAADDMMDLDPPILHSRQDLRRPAPSTFLSEPSDSKQSGRNMSRAPGVKVTHPPSGIRSDYDNDDEERPRAYGADRSYKFSEPRFFGSTPVETGLESLMSGVFSLSDTPAEIRHKQETSAPVRSLVESYREPRRESYREPPHEPKQLSMPGAIHILVLMASLAASGCMYLTMQQDFPQDLPMHTASLATTGLVAAWNLLDSLTAGLATLSLSDAIFFVLQGGIAALLASGNAGCEAGYSSIAVYVSTVHHVALFARSWKAQPASAPGAR